MMSWVRKRLTLSNVGLMIALVFAMTGGAYAAKKYVITSTKQISPTVLKQLRGKNGSNGQAGSVGLQGPAGTPGKDGSPGAPGKDGQPGKDGKEGSPWTVDGTLPSNKTLKGEWSISGTGSIAVDSFSFALPLKKAPIKHYINMAGKEPFYNATSETIEERTQAECPGSAAEPTAEPGHLCVYAAQEEKSMPSVFGNTPLPVVCGFDEQGGGNCLALSKASTTASPFGFGMEAVSEGGAMNVFGSWAVTEE